MRSVALLLILTLVPQVARAQPADAPTDAPPPPPLVEAPPTQVAPVPPAGPPPAAGAPVAPAQPPVPYAPVPNRYGEPPGPEIGLMLTEAAFGMLTAAGSTLLMWYLLVKPLGNQFAAAGGDGQTIATAIFILGFSAIPMTVAQTELGLANGSRYYYSETWPAALSGLAAQAAVIGLHYLARPNSTDGGEAVLLIGTVIAVPLVEMAVINLTKTPRSQLGGARFGAALNLDADGQLRAGIPLLAPVPLQTPGGPQLGVGVPLVGGRF